MKSDSEILQELQEVMSLVQELSMKQAEVLKPIDQKSLIQTKTSWNSTEVISDEYSFKPQKKAWAIEPQIDHNLVLVLIKKSSERIQQLEHENQELLKKNEQLYKRNIELNKKDQYLQENQQELIEKNQLNKKLGKKDQRLNSKSDQLLLEEKKSYPLNQKQFAQVINILTKVIQKNLPQRELEKTKMNQIRQLREECQKELVLFKQDKPLHQEILKPHMELLTLNNQQLSEENQYLNENNQLLREENDELREFIQESLPLNNVYLREENQKLQEKSEQLSDENEQLQKAVKEGTSLIETLTSKLEEAQKTINVINSPEFQSNLTQLKKDNRRLMKWLGYEGERLMQLEKTDALRTDSESDSDSDNNNSPQP